MFLDQGFDLIHGVDQVETFALHHLKRDGVFRIEARGRGAILKCQTDFGDITKGNDPITIHLDRQVVDILLCFKRGGDFDRKSPLIAFDFTSSNQKVVIGDGVDQIASGHVIGFEF